MRSSLRPRNAPSRPPRPSWPGWPPESGHHRAQHLAGADDLRQQLPVHIIDREQVWMPLRGAFEFTVDGEIAVVGLGRRWPCRVAPPASSASAARAHRKPRRSSAWPRAGRRRSSAAMPGSRCHGRCERLRDEDATASSCPRSPRLRRFVLARRATRANRLRQAIRRRCNAHPQDAGPALTDMCVANYAHNGQVDPILQGLQTRINGLPSIRCRS